MNTFSRSFALLKASRQVIKINPSLAMYPIISALSVLVLYGLIATPFIINKYTIDQFFGFQDSWYGWLIIFLVIIITQFIVIYINSAFYISSNKALQGEKISIRQSFGEVWKLRKEVTIWALFSGVIGFLIQYISDKVDYVGQFVMRLLGLAWSLATVFAVPVLIQKKMNPLQTLKYSATLFKRTWGENVIAEFTLSAISILCFLVLMVPETIILLAYFSWATISLPIAIGLSVILFVILIWFSIYLSAMDAVYKAALFRFADTGDYIGPYPKEMIDKAFRPKKK